VRALLAGDRRVMGGVLKICSPYMGSGRGWLAGNWLSTGGVLNITAAAWTAGFQRWRSGDITRTQNVSEYTLVLALCLVRICESPRGNAQTLSFTVFCVFLSHAVNEIDELWQQISRTAVFSRGRNLAA